VAVVSVCFKKSSRGLLNFNIVIVSALAILNDWKEVD